MYNLFYVVQKNNCNHLFYSVINFGGLDLCTVIVMNKTGVKLTRWGSYFANHILSVYFFFQGTNLLFQNEINVFYILLSLLMYNRWKSIVERLW